MALGITVMANARRPQWVIPQAEGCNRCRRFVPTSSVGGLYTCCYLAFESRIYSMT